MSIKTLEQYLAAAAAAGIIDHALRANVDVGGKVTFYIHPLNTDGETLDYVVRGNELAQIVSSDVAGDGVDALLTARIPILDQITELCWAIEKCGASPELTDAVTKAAALRKPITQLVQQAVALGIDGGWMSVSDSNAPGNAEKTGDDQMHQVAGCVGSSCLTGCQPSPAEDAVRLGHCAANVADSLAHLLDRLSIDQAPTKALAGLVKTLADRAEAALGTTA